MKPLRKRLRAMLQATVSAAAGVAAIPMTWLVTGLWAVTMALAGALGNSIRGKLAEMVVSIKQIDDKVGKLNEAHIRLEEQSKASKDRIDGLGGRLDSLGGRLDRMESRRTMRLASGGDPANEA